MVFSEFCMTYGFRCGSAGGFTRIGALSFTLWLTVNLASLIECSSFLVNGANPGVHQAGRFFPFFYRIAAIGCFFINTTPAVGLSRSVFGQRDLEHQQNNQRVEIWTSCFSRRGKNHSRKNNQRVPQVLYSNHNRREDTFQFSYCRSVMTEQKKEIFRMNIFFLTAAAERVCRIGTLMVWIVTWSPGKCVSEAS